MARAPDATSASFEASHVRLGWLLLLAGVAGGATLEAALAMKWSPLLDDALRREMLRLSHFHAGLLGLVNLVYARFADAKHLSAARRRLASRSLRLGALLLPVGFLLGGWWHPEGDPGIGVLLVPPGALALALAAGLQAWASWRAD
jgi:hypothetical protein